MTQEPRDVTITDEEPDAQEATELSDQEAMSLINANVTGRESPGEASTPAESAAPTGTATP